MSSHLLQMKCENIMYLAASLNPFFVLNMHLSLHDLLVVNVTRVNLSVGTGNIVYIFIT